MKDSFVIKPSDAIVSEVEQWFGFQDSDPIRIESDEIHHLVHNAQNVIFVEATASGAERMQKAISIIEEKAAALAPLCTLSSDTAYIIQFVDSPTDQMRVEEMAAVTEWLSSYQDGKDVAWGVSRRSTQEDSVCIRMAVSNLQMKI